MVVASLWAIGLLTRFDVPRTATIVEAARAQVGRTTSYDSAYRRIGYPGGDLPIQTGVCCDVVIRALRASLKLDLQQAVIEDMRRSYASYPQNWGQSRPDSSIDHRRVPNLATYFERQGWSRPVTRNGGDYRPGDIVTSVLPRNLPHIMIISDRQNAAGVPLVIHNIGAGAMEEDRLLENPITGHYRVSR